MSLRGLDFLRETHGIDWPPDEQFGRDFDAWSASLRGATPCEGGKRPLRLREFLQSQRLLTRKYAAAGLGMEPDSLDRLLPELPRIGLSNRYAVYRVYRRRIWSEDSCGPCRPAIPDVWRPRFVLRGADGASRGFEARDPSPLLATAKELSEQMYASTWDNITLLPLSVKHSLWLDFGKPLALSPDRCSNSSSLGTTTARPHLACRDGAA